MKQIKTLTINGNTYEIAVADVAGLADQLRDAQPRYELIETITLEEEATAINRDTDPGGNAYNFSALSVYIETPAVAQTKTLTIGCKHSNGNLGYFNASKGLNTSENATFFRIYNDRGLVEQYYGTGSRVSSITLCKQPRYQNTLWANLTKLSLGASAGSFPVGTTVTIKAIRG